MIDYKFVRTVGAGKQTTVLPSDKMGDMMIVLPSNRNSIATCL
jgi:hypothetical protein